MAAAATLIFVVLLLSLNYDAGWDWATLNYVDLWTPQGMLRHLFFNGFHPVFPWIAFLFAGMWLGRQNLSDSRRRTTIILYSLSVFVCTEGLSWLLSRVVTSLVPAAELTDTLALVDTQMIPPMPFYLLSAGSVACIVILLSIAFTQKHADWRWVQALVSAGQLALTLYAAHVVIGMGVLEALGRLENQSLEFAVVSACIFYAASIVFSVFWRKHFKRGPLEWVMRSLT